MLFTVSGLSGLDHHSVHLRKVPVPIHLPVACSQRRNFEAEVTDVGDDRRRLFSNIAPVYDQLNDTLSLGQHRAWKKLAVQWCKVREGDTLLDVCCGSGDLAYLLASAAGPRGQVTAVDFSADMLDFAGQRSVDWAVGRNSQAAIDWVQGDALSLPCATSQFDAATVGYGLRNVKDIPLALSELSRVLKPGGRAAVLDFNNTSSPLIKGLQIWALQQVVVPMAASYGLAQEYEYLEPSIRRFPTGREQERLAIEAGFSRATHFEVGFGLMGILVAVK